MTIKILSDFHHESLYHSLHLLLERRLGFELYRPIGLEWYKEDMWNVYPHIDTAHQYLGIHLSEEWESIKRKNAGMYCTMPNETAQKLEDGIYLIPDYIRDTAYKAITLDKFKELEFDIVISSMPVHIERFNKLISLYQKKAKHVFQVGNNWNVSRFNVKNVLTSSSLAHPSPEQNSIFYHQEFDLNQNCKVPCENPKSVLNMMHYMQGECLSSFNNFKNSMPDWKWAAHGGGNSDGPVATENIPQAFKDHGFLWHYKREGDGFGYNLFNAAACGRIIITKKSFFRGMSIEPLLTDMETCIDLDKHSKEEAISIMNMMAENFEQYSSNMKVRFDSIVNYDKEEVEIRNFFNNLK